MQQITDEQADQLLRNSGIEPDGKDPAPPPAPESVERISADDLALYRHTEARVAALREGIETLWRENANFLAQRYRIGPGDKIGEDGVIVRAQPREG